MQKLDPKSAWLFFFQSIAGSLFSLFFIILFFSLSYADEPQTGFLQMILGWAFLLVVVVLIISFVWAKLTYHFYRYELAPDGFRKESGVIWKRYVTIPYSRIQNVDIYRGVLARLLGLSDLQLQTAGASAVMSRYGAGGMGSEGRLPGLSKEVAEQLRTELVARAKNNGQGL